MTNSEVQFGELNLDFSSLGKNRGLVVHKLKIKYEKKCKIDPLKFRATGLGF